MIRERAEHEGHDGPAAFDDRPIAVGGALCLKVVVLLDNTEAVARVEGHVPRVARLEVARNALRLRAPDARQHHLRAQALALVAGRRAERLEVIRVWRKFVALRLELEEGAADLHRLANTEHSAHPRKHAEHAETASEGHRGRLPARDGEHRAVGIAEHVGHAV
eukprot:2908105-Prymnesium_polylepis.1